MGVAGKGMLAVVVRSGAPSCWKRLPCSMNGMMATCQPQRLAVLLWPFIPATSAKIYQQLGLAGSPEKFSSAEWGGLPSGHTIGELAPLFPRKDSA